METVKNPADSNGITRDYLDSLLVETRYLDAVTPDLHLNLFGKSFETPLTTGALSHLDHRMYEGAMADLALGAKKAGAMAFIGMEPDEIVEACTATGASVVEVVKPYKDREVLLKKLEHAQACGCIAAAVDIDHPFGPGAQEDVVDGFAMLPLTSQEAAEYARLLKIPFLLKGVLSVQDAEKTLRSGAAGMVLSHHNNRITYAQPALKLLPQVRSLSGSAAVLVDGDIKTGMDAFKALALGATAVSVGRALIPALKDKRSDGVAEALREMSGQLAYAMACTGCATLADPNPTLIHQRNF